MLHQFAHLGDLHLGPNTRNADRLKAFDRFIEEGLALPSLAAWLLPGDLNHARMTIEDRNALAARLQRMAQRAPIVGCYGNHDLPGDLDVFERLGAPHPILFAKKPDIHAIELATGAQAAVFCLPYPTEAGLVGAGIAPGDIVQSGRQALEHIFREAGWRLAAAAKEGRLPLMIGHVNVAGSITATGQPNIGQELEIDAQLLALLGPCYKGLNHIHKGQEIGGAWYPGSVCRLDWGEIDPKRWLLIEYAGAGDGLPVTAGDTLAGIAGGDGVLYRVTPQPLPVPPMYHVEGVLSREGFAWLVKDGPEGEPLEAPRSWAGCEVRVRYRFNASEKRLLETAKARILADFAEAARLELEAVAMPDRALRAPQVAAARTLEEKLIAWAEHAGVVLPAAIAGKLARLEHGDAEQLLSDLQRRLEGLRSGQEAQVAA
jgi:hypothetical protein